MRVRSLPKALSHIGSTIDFVIGDPFLEVPDLAEPIRVWRCWTAEGDDDAWILRSPYQGAFWPPTREWGSNAIRDDARTFVTASCKANTPCRMTPSPAMTVSIHSGLGCGLYGYKEIAHLAWDFPVRGIRIASTKAWAAGAPLQVVWGRALMWGRVYEHDLGYRSEFCQVDEIIHIPGTGFLTQEKLSRIADFYGVPLVVLDPAIAEAINHAIRQREMEQFRGNESPLKSLANDLANLGGRLIDTVKAIGEVADAIAKSMEAPKDGRNR